MTQNSELRKKTLKFTNTPPPKKEKKNAIEKLSENQFHFIHSISKAVIDMKYSAVRKKKGDFKRLCLRLVEGGNVHAYEITSETAPTVEQHFESLTLALGKSLELLFHGLQVAVYCFSHTSRPPSWEGRARVKVPRGLSWNTAMSFDGQVTGGHCTLVLLA